VQTSGFAFAALWNGPTVSHQHLTTQTSSISVAYKFRTSRWHFSQTLPRFRKGTRRQDNPGLSARHDSLDVAAEVTEAASSHLPKRRRIDASSSPCPLRDVCQHQERCLVTGRALGSSHCALPRAACSMPPTPDLHAHSGAVETDQEGCQAGGSATGRGSG